jgi:hypothetical protein
MLRRHLDVVVVPPAVGLLILDTQIGEVDLIIEVGQVVLERPVANLLFAPIGMSVVIGTVAITFVEPGLVLTLELVVEEDALNPRPALSQTLRCAFVGAIDLKVVFQLPRPFEAIPERLAVTLVAVTMLFQQAPPLLRQRDRMLARSRDTNDPNKPLFAQMPQIAGARIG